MGSTPVTEHSFDRKATSIARFLLQETIHSANLAAGHTLRWFPSAILNSPDDRGLRHSKRSQDVRRLDTWKLQMDTLQTSSVFY